MKSKIKYIFLSIIISVSALNTVSAQAYHWKGDEIKYKQTIENLTNYLSKTPPSSINRDSVKSYINFDYALNNIPEEKKEKRLHSVDTLIKLFKYFIDSIGYQNFGIKPVQYFQSNSDFYQPFENELRNDVPNTFAYYNKNSPNSPLGSLLFDQKTGKLMSWILINQSGYHYFLTLDML